jgi:hypothetical protein
LQRKGMRRTAVLRKEQTPCRRALLEGGALLCHMYWTVNAAGLR